MTKYYGYIGFSDTANTKPGVWTESSIMRRPYSGDSFRMSRTWRQTDQVNDNLSVGMEISVVSDPYALQNFHNMKFIEYMGTYWKISKIDVQYPRLILTLGEVYTGDIGDVYDG